MKKKLLLPIVNKIACLLLTGVYLFSAVTPTFAAAQYLYDANGNMTSDGTKCYEYNDYNQLSKVKNCTTNKLIAEYSYDHEGKRNVKKEYDANGNLKWTVISFSDSYEVKKYPDGVTENTSHYFANGQLLAKKNPDGTKNYSHNDHLGSSSILTNQSGNLVEETIYDPWGEVKIGGTKSKFQYTGQEKDLETGLNYYNARYYDSHIRRFTQADDIIQDVYNPQDLNRYSYVRNNPLRYTDPTGHCPVCIVAVGAVVLATEYFLLGALVGGAIKGAINSPDKSFVGRVKSGIVGAQRAAESPAGQISLGIITIGLSIASMIPTQSSNQTVVRQNNSTTSTGNGVNNVVKSQQINIGKKIEGQMDSRGWTQKSINETINNPSKTIPVKDTRNFSGGKLNDPATGYVREDGNYVIVNDNTKDVVQISDITDPAWKAPWDK